MNKIFLDNSIGDILRKYKRNELRPSEVMSAALENIRELNGKYFPWVVFADEAIVAHAKKTPEKSGGEGLLENIPVGVKDIYNTADFPTQMGSPLWKDFTPGNDARAVFNLKRHGAVVAGKTVTAEFAVHTLNETLNPYDATKTPGTSSSGSAVAVSLGMVPLTTGTQTAGSIVRPASFCGVYGCKPSFGTIPRTGMLKTTDSLDTIGFFVLHREDLRRGFDALRVVGKDYPISNAALADTTRQKKPADRPWRVAFVRTHTWKHAPAYAQKALESFIASLAGRKDIEVVEAELPAGMERTHEIHETIYNKALSYYFKNEHMQAEFVSPVMNELISKGQEIDLPTYRKAIDDQAELLYAMDDFFSGYDVLISLSTAGEAPPRNVAEQPDPALMWTLTHLPVVSVPQFTAASGMPFGMQVVARKYNDYLLFDFLDQLDAHGLIPKKAGYCVEK
jgi:Asp-tRNA(Asn)/Glu-tRNA(Gln) amidotransferase A subunit family amidase